MAETCAIILEWSSLSKIFTIVLINLVLSGDNGVAIACAVKGLPHKTRLYALAAGVAGAVALQVVATVFAAQLLGLRFVRLAGGVVILWIALNLFREPAPAGTSRARSANLWSAIWFIVLADISTSTDNILAVAAAAQGNLSLLAFGLALSIPFVVLGSGVISALMERHPGLMYLGAAILGKLGAEMIMTDPLTMQVLKFTTASRYAMEFVGAVAVLAAGGVLRAVARDPSVSGHTRTQDRTQSDIAPNRPGLESVMIRANGSKGSGRRVLQRLRALQ